jgi:hypothetical protein
MPTTLRLLFLLMLGLFGLQPVGYAYGLPSALVSEMQYTATITTETAANTVESPVQAASNSDSERAALDRQAETRSFSNFVASESGTTTLIHFTDQAGMDAIQASGTLRAGSYVTLPSEVAGMSQAKVEEFLEIQPGRGAFNTTIEVPSTQLSTPANGPFTSGGATQFQTGVPTPPGPFVPTEP